MQFIIHYNKYKIVYNIKRSQSLFDYRKFISELVNLIVS